jgi:hypothetical protein
MGAGLKILSQTWFEFICKSVTAGADFSSMVYAGKKIDMFS